MDDLIRRQAVLDELNNIYNEYQTIEATNCLERLSDAIEHLPTAEKKGRWIPLSDGWAECSSCEHLERAAGLRWRYCPNCGARMEEFNG